MSDEIPPQSSGEEPSKPPPAPPTYPAYPRYPVGGGDDGGYPPTGSPAPAGSEGPYQVVAAFNTAFKLFGKHAASFIAMMLIIVVAALVFGGIAFSLSDHSTTTTANSFDLAADFGTGQIIFQIIGNIVSTLLAAALVKGALAAVDGSPVSVGAMFTGWDKLQLLIAAVIVNVLIAVGFMLLIIPGIIVLFLTWFATYFVVDTGRSALDAIGASVRFARDNVGPLLLTGLLAIVVNVVGLCLCGIGLFVSVPVTVMMAAIAFRQLQGRPVVQG